MVLAIIKEMLADFLGFILYVPFPVFTSSLTKKRRTNTKELEEKNREFLLTILFRFCHKNKYIYLKHKQVKISAELTRSTNKTSVKP